METQLSVAYLKSREVHHDSAEGWFSVGGRAFNQRLGRINSDSNPVYGGLAAAMRRYESLLASPAIGAEVLLQLGFLQMLDQKWPQASKSLGEAEVLATDRWITYNAALLRGRWRFGRVDTTRRAAWLGAMHTYPDAPSAARSLATLLYVEGDQVASRRLVELVVEPRSRSDPWDEFAFGEYRHWPARLQAMRALLK